ncbi:YajQ family cyclic di-GMP-binding protein [bacterium CG_4_10_14_0_2_um_filter_33_32]|nr:MAG: YajQ family cyclic di-GMP-binding protein [bacterium CG2_30_33_46]PIR67692.1 MAG: YajQ family cyclic di-GMP-binding protein [bacterium CG10_big_fil_rev_8_21_14_0_10_33_18]PIU76416.1 MAG: YajQ family cyclic di-GMP-binding protein [bacterium CG06_land_8_20_14_3_00_33_50]PIW81063.1 MAG: YajQ family cyclic di-GMP-binding protein [bacterium CG_4_8_14_3_um_filter_33_28]PIY85803.1 MAG: YajQ family cyclic di-GMP-binding protein [bacterium CG_4_10_14_0_8_um_filter_33_57]PIZ85281.1 MAG: YajQ fam
MAKEFSFDIVSDFDIQEMVNAIDQTKREVLTRYDFKGTDPQIEFDEDKKGLILNVSDDYKLTAVLDIIKQKMVKRGLSLKILDESVPKEEASGGRVRKKVPFKKGLNQEDAKKINRIIREVYPKVKPNIQGDTIRVSANSKDDLQSVMQLLKEEPLINIPLQFTNYR